jgi:hypothetical protein
MRRPFLLVLAAAASLASAAACGDTHQPVAPRVAVAGPRTDASTTPLSDYAPYWHNASTLVVYDTRTEYGMNIHYDNGNLATHDMLQSDSLGMRLMRTTLYWDQSVTRVGKPVLGTSYYGTMHTIIQQMVNNNWAPVVIVAFYGQQDSTYQRMALAQCDSTAFKARIGEFMDFAVQGNPGVKLWEFWNEEDATDLLRAPFCPGASAERQGAYYAAGARAFYAAVKRNNPGAQVLIGGLAADDQTLHTTRFMNGFYSAGGREAYDILNFHAYPVSGSVVNNPPDQVLGGKWSMMQNILSSHGDAGRPVWLTETGAGNDYPVHNDPASWDAFQWGWYRDVMSYATAQRQTPKIMWYALFATDGALPVPFSPEYMGDYALGLMRHDHVTHRPAFDSLYVRQVNAGVRAQPVRYGSVLVTPPSPYLVPVGYAYARIGSQVAIYGVTLDSLVPTVIQWQDDGSDPPPCTSTTTFCQPSTGG